MANKRAGKLWLYLDSGFIYDAAIIDVGERAGWLFIAMMCCAKRSNSDGVLTAGQVAQLGITGWRKRLANLIAHELVTEMPLTPGYYLIANWDAWQETAAERASLREKWRNEKKRGDAE